MKKLGFLVSIFALCTFGASSLCAQNSIQKSAGQRLKPTDQVAPEIPVKIVFALFTIVETMDDLKPIVSSPNDIKKLNQTMSYLFFAAVHNPLIRPEALIALNGVYTHLAKILPRDSEGKLILPTTAKQIDSVNQFIQNVNQTLPSGDNLDVFEANGTGVEAWVKSVASSVSNLSDNTNGNIMGDNSLLQNSAKGPAPASGSTGDQSREPVEL